jgi:hypothetical protein
MRDTIERIVAGDDKLFETLIKDLVNGKLLVFAQSEDPEGLTLNFLNYLLEDDQDIEYIPIFTDQEEVNAFVADEDVPDGYTLYEFEGDLFAEIMSSEQYIMINPISGGIVFQGAHLKVFSAPANDDKAE